jgi:hypothetical protein
MYIENNWSGWMSINEFVWQPSSFQYSQNLETRWPLGWITLASNKYEQILGSRISAFFRNYWIADDWTVRELDSSATWFSNVGNLWLTSVINACEFQGYIYFARTSGLSRIPITDFLSQTFGTLQTNHITYSVTTSTSFQLLSTTTTAHRLPYVDTGIPSSFVIKDRDLNDVTAYDTWQTNNQWYIWSTSGLLNNWPYAVQYKVTASVWEATTIPMLNYYDDKLIFAVGNKILYIQDLWNFVYLWMNLIVWQTVSGITESGWYVKVYATQDNKDTRILFRRWWEVTDAGTPAKPEQTIKLNGYVVGNIATDWMIDYAMCWEPDYWNNPNQWTWHLFAISWWSPYKIKSGRFLRRWPTQDYHFSYRQTLSNLAMKNGILYIPCTDWLYSYWTLHKDIPPSLQKDFELRSSWPNKIRPFAIHQYNGTVYLSYNAQDNTARIMKYAQDYEYASYEESGYIIGRVYTWWRVSTLKRINKILMWFEFETTPDWDAKSWTGWTINFYLRKDRNSDFVLIKSIVDDNYRWSQTMRAIIWPTEMKWMEKFYTLEYKIELIRWDQSKTPHIYEYILDDTAINE